MISVSTLRDISIFEGLTDRELEQIAKIGREEVYEPGTRIFAEGALAQNLYILLQGEVDIRIRFNPESQQLSVDSAKDGEIFGWSALTEPYSLTAAAYATKKSKLVVISGDILRDLFEKNNHIGYLVMKEIASVISARLKHTRNRILEFMYQQQKDQLTETGY